VSTLLLGEMLDVARYWPHGGKLHVLCQGWYVWSIWTKPNLRFNDHCIGNRNAKYTTWLDGYHLFYVWFWGWLAINITRCPFRRRFSFYIFYTLDFSGCSPQFNPANKHTTLDQLTGYRRTIGSPYNLNLYAVGFVLSSMSKLAVTYSILTWSRQYILQDFRLLFFRIILFLFTTASYGSTITPDRWDQIWIEPTAWTFILYTTHYNIVAIQTAVSTLWCCQCSHQHYNQWHTLKIVCNIRSSKNLK